jgi:hypothetical protein
MDATPAPSPPPSASPALRLPQRWPTASAGAIREYKARNLHSTAMAIGAGEVSAISRPSPYAMMRACAPTRASMATDAGQGAQEANLPTCRFDPLSGIFDPLPAIDPRRLAEINGGRK